MKKLKMRIASNRPYKAVDLTVKKAASSDQSKSRSARLLGPYQMIYLDVSGQLDLFLRWLRCYVTCVQYARASEVPLSLEAQREFLLASMSQLCLEEGDASTARRYATEVVSYQHALFILSHQSVI